MPPDFRAMEKTREQTDTITDYVSGKKIANVGPEANRQAVERYLVEQKGFRKSDISVNTPLTLTVDRSPYSSRVDLAVEVEGKTIMVIKCAAGSLGSREREIVSAARLLADYQVPLAVVSDGRNAIVLDTVSGRKIGEGFNAVPSRNKAAELARCTEFKPYPKERLEREKIIFRSYDMLNVNVARP